jgi:NMD protein affecting ribosome stability and mRNA decay
MEGFYNHCFVCRLEVTKENSELNHEVNLPVCNNCKGTKKEKETVAEFLDSLADGLVCGCI